MAAWIANGSLRVKLIALLLLVSLLPLGIVAVLDWRQAQERLLQGMRDLLQARGDQLARELEGFHQVHLPAVERIARFQGIRAYCDAAAQAAPTAAEAQARALDILRAWPAGHDAVRGAGLLDRSGRVLVATEPALVGTDLTHLGHVRAALQGATLVSDVFVATVNGSERPSIAYLAPVAGLDGQQTCVAALWVRADALWQALRRADVLSVPGSAAVVLDGRGIRVVDTAAEDRLFRPAGVLTPAEVDELLQERRFGAATGMLAQDVRAWPGAFERARAASPDTAMFHEADVPGASEFAVARRLATARWTAYYLLPAAPLQAELTALTHEQILVAGAGAALAALLGLLFARGLMRRIRVLATVATAIAGGDLAARVRNPRGDELGRLGSSFNAMAARIQAQAADLQRSRDELDARVQARTAELQRATHKLEAEGAERRLAEEAVRNSQHLLQAIIDNSIAVIYVKDLRGRYMMVNRRYRELVRLDEDAILGKTDHELFPRGAADAFRAADLRAAAAPQALLEEEELPQDDGVHTYLSVKGPLRDPNGRVRGTCGISTDITERKQAERRLQAQMERLHLLDQITRAIGERQDLRSIHQVALRSLEEGLRVDFACVLRFDAESGVLAVSRVGAAGAELAAELSLGEGQGLEIEGNALQRCLLGDLVHEPDLAAVPFPFAQRLASGGLGSLVLAPLHTESRVFGVLAVARRAAHAFASGECEFLRQLSAHVALAAQQAQLYEALQRAYDDLRQTQQAVMQQERLRALGQMASGIAHDINNAISPVMLYAEGLLEREPGLSDRARHQLETIARAIDDVASTVARMREFYRQREPQLTLLPLDLDRLVDQVADLTRARWSDMPQQRGVVIRLQRELAGDLPAVLGIESEVREALTNLVFNAVDAMPEGGVLTLRTGRAPDGVDGAGAVEVEVRDTGVGMDEDTRRRCLEPFFTTKGERGTGLGLAMVYGVAQRHGAAIDVDSRPGRGTSVRLRFEAPAPDGPVSQPVVPAAEAAVPMNVLLVDDDPLLLKSLCDMLEADGHAVVTTRGGQAGIDTFLGRRRHPDSAFDVVITDLGMPYVDGRKVAAAVKGASPATPVILLTGWGQRLVADGDIPAHVDEVLGKPPRQREIRAALRRCAEALAPAPAERVPAVHS